MSRTLTTSIDGKRFIMEKRLTIICIIALFIIAFVSAFDQPADASLRKASLGCDVYDQLIALINTSQDFDGQQLWIRTTASLEIPYTLPIALSASSDPRAPPA